MGPPPRFLIFAQGRTGSTLLGELLGSHPRVCFADEILAAKVPSPSLRAELLRARHLRHVVGFHVKIYQLTDVQGMADVGGWLARMHRRGWLVVALRRRNLLRHVLSNMAFDARGRVHDRTGDGARRPLVVDPSELLHWMGVREQVGRDETAALGTTPHLPVTYEDDLADPAAWPATTGRIFGELGLAPAPVATNLRRINAGRLDELIANYAEVAAAVEASPYAAYLD